MLRRIPPSLRGRGVALAQKSCVECGLPFLTPTALAARYVTCSAACSSARKRAQGLGSTQRTCEQCGRAETVKIADRGRRYCSNDCRLAALNALPRRHMDGFTGGALTAKGYIRGTIWRDGKRSPILEHRLVMEQKLGRRLTPKERVHHLDGDRTNNAPENLELFDSHAGHLRHAHVADWYAHVPERRRRVLELVGKGLSRPAIARELGLSPQTVHNDIRLSK